MPVSVTEHALPVLGELPDDLSGCFLQAFPHPARTPSAAIPDPDRLRAALAPPILAGVRVADGRAYKMSAHAPHPAPHPALLGSTVAGHASVARPMGEPGGARWHTVASYPGLGRADHLVIDDGDVVRARSFPLPGEPLLTAVAVTERFVVVFDQPMRHSRAAALVGLGFPYAWRPDRPARVGLLPLDPERPARWFEVSPAYVTEAVNAYDAGTRVIVDAICHRHPADGDTARLRRIALCLASGGVLERELAPARHAVVDSRVTGTAHRFVVSVSGGASGGALTVHDLATGGQRRRAFGPEWRLGEPVFAPRPGGGEGAGWIAVLAQDPVRRRARLVILDAMDVAAPGAEVELPDLLPDAVRVTWAPARPARAR
ncbi:carotenoid oxygenase family protein [Streptosporangiaceae bacterium NEAU-GS5]|nr:carotenoid oxygenase family protein [Streptosporangiaceae bacterium NEAU-GS5]